MTIFLIFLLSSVFTVIFITLHLLFLYFFSSKKITHQKNQTLLNILLLISFILSNLILIYFAREVDLYKLFYNSFIINLSILIIYFQFFNVLKMGFTLSIITLFKKKRKLLYKELIKNYGNGKGAKWILIDRLSKIDKLKIIRLNKKIELTQLGQFLSIILIVLRKILSVRDFG